MDFADGSIVYPRKYLCMLYNNIAGIYNDKFRKIHRKKH
jgi:hypothetical protein